MTTATNGCLVILLTVRINTLYASNYFDLLIIESNSLKHNWACSEQSEDNPAIYGTAAFPVHSYLAQTIKNTEQDRIVVSLVALGHKRWWVQLQ